MTEDKQGRIVALSALFQRCSFNKTACDAGLKAITKYHYEDQPPFIQRQGLYPNPVYNDISPRLTWDWAVPWVGAALLLASVAAGFFVWAHLTFGWGGGWRWP